MRVSNPIRLINLTQCTAGAQATSFHSAWHHGLNTSIIPTKQYNCFESTFHSLQYLFCLRLRGIRYMCVLPCFETNQTFGNDTHSTISRALSSWCYLSWAWRIWVNTKEPLSCSKELASVVIMLTIACQHVQHSLSDPFANVKIRRLKSAHTHPKTCFLDKSRLKDRPPSLAVPTPLFLCVQHSPSVAIHRYIV